MYSFLQMIIQNLTMYQLYEVKVAAATFSIINPKKIILGKFSEGRKVSKNILFVFLIKFSI